jgi:hypothetical protein
MRTNPNDKTDKYDYRPMILTHLDASGHLINERLIVPKIRSERGVLFSTGCVRWGNDVAIVGHLMHSGAHVEGLMNPNTDQCYWLLVVDADGNTKWEKQIESWDGIGGALPPMVLSDSSLVFAGKPFNKTELFRFNTDGDLVAKKSLTGNFIFVHTDTANGEIQLYGYDRDKRIGTVLTLNSQFSEVQHIQGKEAPDSAPSLAYRMPDNSLVLFGRKIHTWGEQYTSAVAKVDSNLKSIEWIEVAHGVYSDTGTIDAAAPTGNSGEFVIARILMNLHEAPGSDQARVGMALDFIQIK